jgi:preprotein translocase subunit SecG
VLIIIIIIIIIIVIFITGLHKKPQGCGASLASAAGPYTTKKKRSVKTVL